MASKDGFGIGELAGDGSRGQDLRALAALDALGMLDEVDAGDFDRAFREASPAAQSELRELQAAVATDPAFLGASDEPPADLKARTLARMMTAVERQEASFAPIAHIGRTAAHAARGHLADQRSAVAQAVEVASLRRDIERLNRSGYAWRAAAIALVAALAASLAFQAATRELAATVTAYAIGAVAPEAMMAECGHPGANARIEAATASVSASGAGGSVVVTANSAGLATVVAVRVTPRQEYVLRFIDDAGNATELRRFVALRANWVDEFQLEGISPARLSGGTLEVIDSSGTVVMRTARG